MHMIPPNKTHLWGTAIVGTKGQIVIPAKARNKLDIKEGDRLLVIGAAGKPVIGLVKSDKLEGMLAKMQDNIEVTLKALKQPIQNKKG